MTDFTVKDEDIKALRIKVLRALATARYPLQAVGSVAGNNGISVADVKSLVERYGWPEPKEMARHAIELAGGAVRPEPLARGEVVRPTPLPAVLPLQASGLDALLAGGEKSGKARTRRLAVKICEQLAELRGLVNTEIAEREAAARAAAEKNRLLVEVKELEAALAEKRAALRPQSKAGPVTDRARASTRNSEIRAWAADNGLECNQGPGRISRAVVEAFDAAHQEQAS